MEFSRCYKKSFELSIMIINLANLDSDEVFAVPIGLSMTSTCKLYKLIGLQAVS